MQKLTSLILRYSLILASSLGSLYVFYLIFTPLTLYPAYLVLSLFYSVSLEKTTLIVNGTIINLIGACVAGAAYFLLLMLNLSTPNIRKRGLVLLFEMSSFLMLNLLRIIILSALFMADFSYFMQAHLISWHLLSGLFVFVIWIITIKMFKIKEIPFYSDFLFLKKLIKIKKKRRVKFYSKPKVRTD